VVCGGHDDGRRLGRNLRVPGDPKASFPPGGQYPASHPLPLGREHAWWR